MRILDPPVHVPLMFLLIVQNLLQTVHCHSLPVACRLSLALYMFQCPVHTIGNNSVKELLQVVGVPGSHTG